MKKVFVLSILGLLIFYTSFGQTSATYRPLVSEANNLYESKDYEKSAEKYNEAFESNDGKAFPNDRYNAACSYALANNTEKAFYHLFRLAEHPNVKYNNYNHITNDSDLTSLHADARWTKLIDIVKANKDELEKNLDKPLVAILDTIYIEDQSYRQQIDEIEKKYGWESPEMKAHWKIINEKDSINLIRVKKILDERGWLGADIIGGQGNSTLFLVIQHADLETQEKYLPMMREAVKNKKAQSNSLALLEDRVALRKGGKQIYGSQIGRDAETNESYVLPLEDPTNVDKRRAEVGLSPIQEYISRWNITWNVEEYIKKLPEYEAKQKK